MEFEKGDYIINIEKLKAKFFDQLSEMVTSDGKIIPEASDMLATQMAALAIIMDNGQKME